MRLKQTVLCLMSGAVLSGCTAINKLADKSQPLVAAEPLSITAASVNDATDKKLFLGSAATDSVRKCTAFLNRLVVTQNSVNTVGDVSALTLSGLATVLKSINTVHALTASSALVTGSKSAINSNIYAEASISTFQMALQRTYYKAMTDYVDDLDKASDTAINIGVELSRIETIHSNCSLSAARSSIEATIGAKGKKESNEPDQPGTPAPGSSSGSGTSSGSPPGSMIE
jgi:hypothetical protein